MARSPRHIPDRLRDENNGISPLSEAFGRMVLTIVSSCNLHNSSFISVTSVFSVVKKSTYHFVLVRKDTIIHCNFQTFPRFFCLSILFSLFPLHFRHKVRIFANDISMLNPLTPKNAYGLKKD